MSLTEHRPAASSIPETGSKIPIASITQNASTITLDLKAVGGSYSGKVNAEGTELVGTFIQGTAVLPLTFRRLPPGERTMTRRLPTLAALIALGLLEASGTVRGQSARRAGCSGVGRLATSCRTRKGLASSWPAGGPKKLWSRALGEGHSSIVVENGRLYTLYRQITNDAAGDDPRGSRRRI